MYICQYGIDNLLSTDYNPHIYCCNNSCKKGWPIWQTPIKPLVDESDMYLKPDFNTFALLPWRDKYGSAAARIICDVHNADESPFIGCPRQNLKRVLAEAREKGYTMNVGTECEFFLFKQDANGQATTITDDVASYFDTDPADAGTDCRRKIIQTLEAMGFEIETSHLTGKEYYFKL